MTTYTKRYKKAIAAIGKPENLRETEGYFMVRFRLVTLSISRSYMKPRKTKVQVTWSAIGAVSPAESKKFITLLAKVTKLAARMERDIIRLKKAKPAKLEVDKQTAGWIGVIKSARKTQVADPS